MTEKILIGIGIFSVLLNVWLIRNNFKLQQYIQDIFEMYRVILKRMSDTDIQLTEVDKNGAFKTDDEVGFVFKMLRASISDLQTFLTNLTQSKKPDATDTKH